jgi:tRNA A37 methylthiotransferase MiaB
LIGKELEVLIEGKNKKSKSSWELIGRTRQDKVVVIFDNSRLNQNLIGNIIKVKIEYASTYYLKGRLIS